MSTVQEIGECPVKYEEVTPTAEGCKAQASEAYISLSGKPLSYINDPQTVAACPHMNPANKIEGRDLVVDPNLPLPTIRQVSSIPRANPEPKNETEYWVYPSQHQFYNAMKRKNFDPKEDDMQIVVSLHNAVNERAWRDILKWEQKYREVCASPKLVRFEGKAKDYSPRALWKSFWGAELPFDRHDWVVDRCGTEVRYVLDFYSGKQTPNSFMSMHIDVRPALDSAAAVYDRVEKWFTSFF